MNKEYDWNLVGGVKRASYVSNERERCINVTFPHSVHVVLNILILLLTSSTQLQKHMKMDLCLSVILMPPTHPSFHGGIDSKVVGPSPRGAITSRKLKKKTTQKPSQNLFRILRYCIHWYIKKTKLHMNSVIL